MPPPATHRQADIKRAVAGVAAGARAAGIADFRIDRVEILPNGTIVIIPAGTANDDGGPNQWDHD